MDGLLGKLSPAVLSDLRKTIRKTQWYPYGHLVDLLWVVERELGVGNRATCEQLGFACGKRDLNTIFPHFIAEADPEAVLQGCTGIWAAYHDFGTMQAVAVAPAATVLRIESVPDISPMHCAFVFGWFMGALDLLGARTYADAKHTHCSATGSAYCEFTCRWRPPNQDHANQTREIPTRKK